MWDSAGATACIDSTFSQELMTVEVYGTCASAIVHTMHDLRSALKLMMKQP